MAVPSRAELEVLVRERLESDPGFRVALVADPRGAVSQLVGVDLPDVVTVTVHEESLTDIHLVLPAAAPATGELAEDDLELVAGGVCWSHEPPVDPRSPLDPRWGL